MDQAEPTGETRDPLPKPDKQKKKNFFLGLAMALAAFAAVYLIMLVPG